MVSLSVSNMHSIPIDRLSRRALAPVFQSVPVVGAGGVPNVPNRTLRQNNPAGKYVTIRETITMNQPSTPWILETTDATFERDVFERSREAPVVVDFWAAWCAPCRMLAPILEQAVSEREGKLYLVKAETD